MLQSDGRSTVACFVLDPTPDSSLESVRWFLYGKDLRRAFSLREMDATETTASIQVTVNGSPQRLPRGATVADLVANLGLRPENIAVEVNLALVPRTQHRAHQLHPGDQLEIVTLVGGGSLSDP